MSFVSQNNAFRVGKRKLRFSETYAMLSDIGRFFCCVPIEFHPGQSAGRGLLVNHHRLLNSTRRRQH